MDRYAVFGDTHGDIMILERFLHFLEAQKQDDITHVFFTGDFFGLDSDKGYESVLAERERQYREIEWLLERHLIGKKLFVVQGNYDLFGDHFQLYNLHHKTTYKSTNVDGKVVYGHGGSWIEPSDIVERLKERGKKFDWSDYQYLDSNQEFEKLCRVKPEIILSHSPIKRYVTYFLTEERQGFEYPQRNNLFYFGGHTHVSQYYDVTAKDSDRRVYVIQPGALGRTFYEDEEDEKTDKPLPQTFMLIYPRHVGHCTLLTWSGNRFYPKRLNLKHKTLEEYIQ